MDVQDLKHYFLIVLASVHYSPHSLKVIPHRSIHIQFEDYFHKTQDALGVGEGDTVSQIRDALRMLLFVSIDFHGLKLKIIQEK